MFILPSQLPFLLVVPCLIIPEGSEAKYYQAAAMSYKKGETVPLEFKALTSIKTQAPITHESIFPHFCRNDDDHDDKNNNNHEGKKENNLREFLQGTTESSTPYVLKMKDDVYCQQLCIVDLGDDDDQNFSYNNNVAIQKAIHNEYHHNWIVDKLDIASKIEDDETIITRYWQGFPVGYISYLDNNAYIHNHVNIEIMYHPVSSVESGEGGEEDDDEYYRVVRVAIDPFSIKHEFVPIDDDIAQTVGNITKGDEVDGIMPSISNNMVASITNPIESCKNPKGTPLEEEYGHGQLHTNYDMITYPPDKREPQLASGKVLFTYDVIWTQNDELTWGERYDIFLSMDNAIPDKVHWIAFFNSMIVVTIIFGIILAAYIRRLRNAAKLAPIGDKDDDDDDVEEQEEDKNSSPGCCCSASCSNRQMWRLLHGDVFRPPKYPLLLAVYCGTGAQLISTCIVSLGIGMTGLWHPSRHPSMILDLILVYAAFGWVGGFVTAQKCQELGIRSSQGTNIAALVTALGFPGLLFVFFLGVFSLGDQMDSTWGTSTTTSLSLLGIWLLLMAPLTFLGSWFGRRRLVKEFPVDVAEEPRAIPKRNCISLYACPGFGKRFMSCFLNCFFWPFFSFCMNGIWSFSAGFVELYFTLAAIWMQFWHQPFFYLAIGFALVAVTCSLVNILTTYWQLCRENHRWWWCSFRNGASTGLFVWLYSTLYFKQLEATGFFAYYLYFGSITILSIGLAMMLGYVGLSSSTLFNRAIYSMIVHTN